MKALFGVVVLCLGVVGWTGAEAKPGASDSAPTGQKSDLAPRPELDANVARTNDRFNGAWEVDWSKSKYIDELKSRKSSPESKGPRGVKKEVVTLTIANNKETCINDLTYEDGTRTTSEYTGGPPQRRQVVPDQVPRHRQE